MSRPFKVGDKVKAFGVNGIVISVTEDSRYPVIVTYDNTIVDTFTVDGKLSLYHKLPSLKHRKFKKNTVKEPRVVWIPITDLCYLDAIESNNTTAEILKKGVDKTDVKFIEDLGGKQITKEVLANAWEVLDKDGVVITKFSLARELGLS